MIKIENVSFQYKGTNKKILENINLEIQEGEIVAIVGKNGSGKSTLGKLISGILKLKQGSITIDNIEVKDKKNNGELRNKVGIVFQNPENQIVFNDIHDELAFALKDINKEEVAKRIENALEKVEMLEVKNQDLYTLSLGQKQRVMIAEMLTKNPKYIILDEPTTMIDSLGKEKIYQIIRNLKQQGYTLICITNLADEILLADRTIILEAGEIVAEIKKEELVEKAEILKQHEIKLPTLLEILYQLKQKGIELNLQNYTIEELTDLLEQEINKG